MNVDFRIFLPHSSYHMRSADELEELLVSLSSAPTASQPVHRGVGAIAGSGSLGAASESAGPPATESALLRAWEYLQRDCAWSRLLVSTAERLHRLHAHADRGRFASGARALQAGILQRVALPVLALFGLPQEVGPAVQHERQLAGGVLAAASAVQADVLAELRADQRTHGPPDASPVHLSRFYSRCLRNPAFAASVFGANPRAGAALRVPLPPELHLHPSGQSALAQGVASRAWRRRVHVVASRQRAFEEE